MSLTLWRSVRRAHAARAFTGEGAARFPGRYNPLGVRAVYFADAPAGCALELLASYAAPEAITLHVLFAVEVTAPLVDLRREGVRKRYGVTTEQLTAPEDYTVSRRLGARLRAEGRAGAIVPAATVACAFNAVVFPEVWSGFRVLESMPLAFDARLRVLRDGGHG